VSRIADRDQLKPSKIISASGKRIRLYATFRTGEELRRLVSQHLPEIVSEAYSKRSETSSSAFFVIVKFLRNVGPRIAYFLASQYSLGLFKSWLGALHMCRAMPLENQSAILRFCSPVLRKLGRV
jgi:hypothetical protein